MSVHPHGACADLVDEQVGALVADVACEDCINTVVQEQIARQGRAADHGQTVGVPAAHCERLRSNVERVDGNLLVGACGDIVHVDGAGTVHRDIGASARAEVGQLHICIGCTAAIIVHTQIQRAAHEGHHAGAQTTRDDRCARIGAHIVGLGENTERATSEDQTTGPVIEIGDVAQLQHAGVAIVAAFHQRSVAGHPGRNKHVRLASGASVVHDEARLAFESERVAGRTTNLEVHGRAASEACNLTRL